MEELPNRSSAGLKRFLKEWN